MNAAEQLKKQMEQNAPVTKKNFIEEVKKQILHNGRFTFTINARADNLFKFDAGGATLSPQWKEIAERWAMEEGFSVKRFCGYYGVPEYDITL